MKHRYAVGALCMALAVCIACARQASSEGAPESFASFWTGFRAAALAGKADQVAAVTRFPFETRGTLDDSPVRKHDRASFPALLGTLLEQDPGMRPEPETMRALLERTPKLEDGEVVEGGESAQIGVFVFARIDGKWRFTRAYVEE